ncbi:unnamed protein product [Schistosoma mattheei]|uniref:Uncharacterized protein n=1 Tax=Schistosoma mattheei TaxID=31246 RepID=A0A183PGC8_9TREM|nr:unnamed protein product [Schistosoma mattheei]
MTMMYLAQIILVTMLLLINTEYSKYLFVNFTLYQIVVIL